MLISAFIISIGISLVQPTQSNQNLRLGAYSQSEEIPFSSLSAQTELSDANREFDIASFSFSFSCPGYIVDVACTGNTLNRGFEKFDTCQKELGKKQKTKIYFDKIELVSKKNPAVITKGSAVFVVRID